MTPFDVEQKRLCSEPVLNDWTPHPITQGESIHPSEEGYRLYPQTHSFAFKRPNPNSLNKKNQAWLTDFWHLSTTMLRLVIDGCIASRTQYTGIWHQLKFERIRLNSRYVWYPLVTVVKIGHLVRHSSNPYVSCVIPLLQLYATFTV